MTTSLFVSLGCALLGLVLIILGAFDKIFPMVLLGCFIMLMGCFGFCNQLIRLITHPERYVETKEDEP
jgi:hypothetical protein